MFESSLRSHSFITMTCTFHHATQTQTPTTPETISSLPVLPTSIPSQSLTQAATLIQSAYRSHFARALFRTISSVDARTSLLQRIIQRQDTVDAIRADEKERLRLNEELMGLLLTLDGVRRIDEAIRTARRKAIRRIVGLQEIVDGVCESRLGLGEVEEMEEVCKERGGTFLTSLDSEVYSVLFSEKKMLLMTPNA